jgi:hypothetical protein
MAQKKKQLVAAGKLDKYGRPNEATPQVQCHVARAVGVWPLV